MSVTIKRLGAAAGLVMGLAALLGGACFYWQTLLDKSVPARAPISISDLKPAGGFGAYWQLPELMRARRWAYTGARVWEAGKALPLRVEAEAMVTGQGQGRFCVQGERLCFSASDSTDPAANGRNYEFEVRRPDRQAAIMAAALFAVAAALGAALLPFRKWLSRLARMETLDRAGRARWFRLAGLFFLSLAVLRLLLTAIAFYRQVPIPVEDMLLQPEGQFHYHLARWIRRNPLRAEAAVLLEDGRPLRRTRLEALKQASARGSFASENDYVCFRASDLSSPSANGRVYSLKVFLFPLPEALGWALFFGSLGWLLLGQSEGCRRGQAGPPGMKHWWGAVLAMVIFKLWVVAGDDPIGSPSDGWAYALSAARMIWGESGELSSHPAGFPFISGLAAQFGLPWRMALELLYLGACGYLALAVVALARSRLAGFLVFLMLAWHPWTITGFANYMADPVVPVLLLTLLGLMFRLLRQPPAEWKVRAILPIGVWLFLWEWARHEGPLICASYGLFAALAWQAARSHPGWARPGQRRLARWLAVPLIMVLALSTAVKWINYQRGGLYAKSMIHSPGMDALLKALYRIKPEQDLRYAPVTRQSLRAACEASPTLKPFEERLLTPLPWIQHPPGSTNQGPPEFGSDLLWQLTTLPGDRRTANAIMLKGAAEINAALRAGRLPSRRAWYPLDPNWRMWLPALPASFLNGVLAGMSLESAGKPWGTVHKATMQHTYDVAASRRAANLYPRLLLAEGTVKAPPGAIDSVALSDEQGRWLGASRTGSPDGRENGQPFDFSSLVEADPGGYRLTFFQRGKPQYAAEFEPALPAAGRRAPGEYSRLVEKRESNLALPQDGQTFDYYFKAGVAQPTKQARRETAEKIMECCYQDMLWCSLGLVCICVLAGGRWERRRVWSAALCLMLAAGWFLGRAALYAVLDVNTGWGFGRYMQCVSPVFVLILFLATAVAAAFLRRTLRQHPAPARQGDGCAAEPG